MQTSVNWLEQEWPVDGGPGRVGEGERTGPDQDDGVWLSSSQLGTQGSGLGGGMGEASMSSGLL